MGIPHHHPEEPMVLAADPFSTCRAAFPALRRTLAGQPLAFFDGPGGTQVIQETREHLAAFLGAPGWQEISLGANTTTMAARAIVVMGLDPQGGVVRAGISMYTSEADVQRLLDGVAAIAGA
jgi:selenocysteine lyase/cysteine desulfurase